MRTLTTRWFLPTLLSVALVTVARADEPAAKRTQPWKTPWVTGSPEPPPAYKTVRLFPKVQFKNPVTIEMPPGESQWWVAEPAGKLSVITPTDDGGRVDLVLDIAKELKLKSAEGEPLKVTYLYGVAFHPKFAENREIFLCYTVVPPKAGVHLPDGSRLSRFKVTPGPVPKVDFASEELLLTFKEGGHNGACLEFGPDGCLYISTGDAGDASPPDMNNTGQDTTDLLSSILRIDVDHRDPGLSYAVPKDNPFVGRAGFRPEIWAFGFRNPWKMSFDRQTGELWVGDIGWELWEMVHRVERGGNYGWSVMEGPQPMRFDLSAAPVPITPPLLALPHTDAASVTGGFVYRGKKFPELTGKYIFGDWETHRVWSLKAPVVSGDESASARELVDLVTPSIRIIDFGQDHDGELVIMDYDAGTIHGLERNNPADSSARPFPKKLSETGLFKSVVGHQVADGVMSFEIAAEMWHDGLEAKRFVALPNDDAVKAYRLAKQTPGSMFRRHFEFPKDSVLMKTLSTPAFRQTPSHPVETQLLHFDGLNWQAYSYRWNEERSDADLVPSEGDEAIVELPGESAKSLNWTFASRSQCITCHTPWAESTLAFTTSQLITPLTKSEKNRLDELEATGFLVRQAPTQPPPKSLTRWDEESVLVPPFDEKYPLEQRARSYLDANCAHCHRFGGGGTAQIDLRAGIPIERTKTINEVPTKGDLGLKNARIITPGNPYRSVLLLRMAKCGRGRMPHIGSELPDERGLDLIEKWIRAMSEDVNVDEIQFGKALASRHALRENPSFQRRAEELKPLFSDLAGTLLAARLVDGELLPNQEAADVIAIASESADAMVRDLFATHLPKPPADRVGSAPRPRLVLQKQGNADRGKWLFQSSTTLNCKVCHRIGPDGGQVGPELTRIARTRRREELLDSLLNPSALVDPKFAAYVIQLRDGRVSTGVITNRTEKEITLRDAKNNPQPIALADVEEMKPQRTSLMPDGLLKDLTLTEAADLLAYLESLR